jgi:hypothetical protein
MSAQAYTNKLRLLAEAGVTKVQYPGRIALNKNPILSTSNCSPDFSVINYIPNPRCCVYSQKNIPVIDLCIDTLDGGLSQTNGYIIYDGNCKSNCYIISGGDSNTSITCENITILEIVYDGGSASTASTTFLSV